MDNSFDSVNSTGNLLQSAILLRRSMLGDGISLTEARRVLCDIHLAATILHDAFSDDLTNISTHFGNGHELPDLKVRQAQQDMAELASGLKLASSAAFSASRALCVEFNYGIPAAAEQDAGTANASAGKKPPARATAAK